MDKGAHFYRTDFQIHSPRDNNWNGSRPLTEDDRLEFARKLVKECRSKSIHAVAITDHHDVCFIKYFQYVAQEDKVSSYSPKPLLQDPIIFPGVELALTVPCQVIVLLDADADLTIQKTLLAVCGISPHPDDQATGPDVQPLTFDSLEQLDERLSNNPVLKGKFIILPNVSNKSGTGYKSLLREQGFNAKYASMPCVGGYIECDWDEQTKKNILEGEAKEWGYKALGIFQTSDSRREDLSTLGQRTSWVKMATPTTESLRQACLARKSRIYQSEPHLPSLYIRRIQVSDSLFLGPIDLKLNNQFNALIGGRGTGKTTILEYIRYAMQDQPPDNADEEIENDEIKDKRKRIIQTLKQRNGSVTVEWVKNDVPHILSFRHGTQKPELQVGDGEFLETTPEEIKTILPLQAYSQKQLSTVGTREKELRRFIEQPIQEALTKCNEHISEKRNELIQLYERLSVLNDKNRILAMLNTQARSIKEQAETAEKTLPQLSKILQKALSEHPLRLREKQSIDLIKEDYESAKDCIETATEKLLSLPRPLAIDEKSSQIKEIKLTHAKLTVTLNDIRSALADHKIYLEKEWENILVHIDNWQDNQAAHEKLYKDAAEEAKEHKQKLELIEQLRTQEAELQKQVSELEKEVSDLPSVMEEFEDSWHSWVSTHRERGDIVEQACQTLTVKSGGEIETELQRGADCEKALSLLKDILRGCNIRDTNWDALQSFLVQNEPAKAWMSLMKALRPLAEMNKEDLPPDENIPDISCWPLTPTMRRNIVDRLKPARRWLDVALTSLEDKPVFYFKPSNGERIKFENASAGQQATALIKVLLKETTGPLIIDQPEDDLDNATIQQIAEELWIAKERRQIIFSSHNANIVVNGDAELIIHCNYLKEDDRTKGYIASEGAIDIPQTREAIQKVMEGGKKAFELRRQKYGF